MDLLFHFYIEGGIPYLYVYQKILNIFRSYRQLISGIFTLWKNADPTYKYEHKQKIKGGTQNKWLNISNITKKDVSADSYRFSLNDVFDLRFCRSL